MIYDLVKISENFWGFLISILEMKKSPFWTMQNSQKKICSHEKIFFKNYQSIIFNYGLRTCFFQNYFREMVFGHL